MDVKSVLLILGISAYSVIQNLLLNTLVAMKTTFFKVCITENVIRVIGFPQNQIVVALYGYQVI